MRCVLLLLSLQACNSVLGLETRPARGERGEGGADASGGAGTGGIDAGGNAAVGGASAGGAGGAGPAVGDCVLDAGESCDDCNAVGGDGCDEQGAVEVGWHCPTPGEHCWRVSGYAVVSETSVVEAGGNGGSAFDHDCGPGRVHVGVAAHNTTEGGSPALGQLRGRCAPITISGNTFGWGPVDLVTSAVGQEPNSSLGDIDCPAGTVAAGLHARSTGVIRGYTILCTELRFEDGAVRSSNETTTTLVGTGPLSAGEQRCPADTAVTSFAGRSGALIDRLTMGCDSLTPTYCGDGQLDAPFEACDDGNITIGDGCDDACAME